MSASPSTAGPSSNWAKLQGTIASTSSSAGPSRKGKERSADGPYPRPSADTRSSAGSRGRKGMSGISSFARNTTKPDNTTGVTVAVNVPAPSIVEGVMFKPLPEATKLQVELREMVAGRTPMTEGRKAPGNYIAIDCEMVGLGHMGSESALARVSLVNFHGYVVLDTFVAPRERVTDWRTWVSGVRERDIIGAPTFEEVQKTVAGLVDGRILVGHAIDNDLKVLLLNHPGPMVRDTQKCKALREKAKNKRPGLKKLAEMELGLEIQKGAHSSVTDARATMALYRLHKVEWEKQLRPVTEAFKAKTGKRKRSKNDEGEDEEGGSGRKEEFPGGGKKGISSGLGLIVKKNGVRLDNQKKKGAKSGANGTGGDADTGGSGLNWWEEDAQ